MRRRFLIDTNLAILLVVGLTNRTFIARHKRLKGFDEIDFDLLRRLIGPPSAWVFTPNVLTEVSNLTRQIDRPSRAAISCKLAEIIAIIEEKFIPSEVVVGRDAFLHLGLADAVIMEAATSELTIITADIDLYIAALNAGRAVQNFTHFQERLRPDFR